SDLLGKCPGGTCPPSQQSSVDGYNTLGLVSTIGFIVGGVGLAGGAVLILTAPKSHASARVGQGAGQGAGQGTFISPYVGPGSAGITGKF
ncbi:MAG: hypothetical protein ACRELY_26915, partial [Polyangiaceae bacterium]